jgi:hypothetical protein
MRPASLYRPAGERPSGLWTNPMISGLPSSEIAWLALALLARGVLTGFLAGLLGIGGGGIVVPVLYEVFRLSGVSDHHRLYHCRMEQPSRRAACARFRKPRRNRHHRSRHRACRAAWRQGCAPALTAKPRIRIHRIPAGCSRTVQRRIDPRPVRKFRPNLKRM